MEKNLQIYRGDDEDFDFTFVDGNGDPIDITGWTLFLTIKTAIDNETDDSGAVVTKTVTTHTNPTQGETTVSILDTDTNELNAGDYYYDFQVKKSI